MLFHNPVLKGHDFSRAVMRKEAVAAQIKAKEIAHKLIPPLLDAIELEARRVVHDESHS
jgi:hypothetical protein